MRWAGDFVYRENMLLVALTIMMVAPVCFFAHLELDCRKGKNLGPARAMTLFISYFFFCRTEPRFPQKAPVCGSAGGPLPETGATFV